MTHLWSLLSESLDDGVLLHTPTRQDEPFTGTALAARAERTAGGLLTACGGRPPRRAALLMANGEPWVRGLLALLRLDAAAVPLALPVAFGGADAYAAHVRRIAQDADLDAVLVDGSVGQRILSRVTAALPAGVAVVDIAEPPAAAAPLPPHGAGGALPAVIQYTSGSTSAPKGVLVSHDNAAAGLEIIAAGTGWGDDDVLGMWLPLFHDMGLFSLLTALRQGSPVHLWQPGDFVRRPMAWLSAFAAAGATVIPAPNFFYDYLVAAAAKGIPDDLDLSRWRYGGNGSEPVRLDSLTAFHDTFRGHGLRPGVVQPNYGLAEATLMVSTGAPGSAHRSVRVDRSAAGIGDTVRTAGPGDGPEARTVVSCGRPVGSVRVRIATEEGAALPPGTVGEIQLSGAPVTSGYLGLPAGRQPFTGDGWLRTGDIGFLAGGEVHVMGRLKAMAVVRGQNYYAEDVEDVVKSTPGVGRRQCAAFAWDSDGEERMVVIWETGLDRAAAEAVGDAIRTRLAEQLGLGAVDVVHVPTSTLPFTSSGKVKRSGAADLYRTRAATRGDTTPVPAATAAAAEEGPHQ
ncbi:AMP-binding protein [Streptomyces sp. NPDC021020]|uniref:AMP-binding protein n=1 Tax=Streptomyces sp. NPDC021020 TaxID=3365109 RepID=UPI00379EB48A